MDKCKHCGIETGGADCCFKCLLETSPKARAIFQDSNNEVN